MLTLQNTPIQNYHLGVLAEKRGYSIDLIKQLGMLYIPSTEYLLEHFYSIRMEDFVMMGIYYSNGRCQFAGAIIIPVYTPFGIQGFVGYDLYEIYEGKYFNSHTKNYAKNKTFYGVENLPEIYAKDEVYLVEGIFDRIAIESLGITNVLSSIGSLTKEKLELLKPIKHIIVIPDSPLADYATFKVEGRQVKSYGYWQYLLQKYVGGLGISFKKIVELNREGNYIMDMDELQKEKGNLQQKQHQW